VGWFTDEPAVVGRYLDLADRISESALDEVSSRHLLRAVAARSRTAQSSVGR
jgi:hypothetical protein